MWLVRLGLKRQLTPMGSMSSGSQILSLTCTWICEDLLQTMQISFEVSKP